MEKEKICNETITSFTCPKCGAVFNRDKHYLVILETQNIINKIHKNKEINDFCSNCNYYIEVE